LTKRQEGHKKNPFFREIFLGKKLILEKKLKLVLGGKVILVKKLISLSHFSILLLYAYQTIA
jgi:hypothetical protein